MRRALIIATVVALAAAKPETYRETEDFQYSRSSSDEGSKSGFYGAQRGNMGGNYERAHNMDQLAQHQMGGLVRTVDGELGDGAKQKSGSVFSAANSRGVYGSGHYDLSNLQGRNFQEGTSFGDTQSSSLTSQRAGYGSQSQSYSSAANSGYGSQSQNSRYRGYGYNEGSDQALYSNMQSAGNLQSASQHDGTQSTGYHSLSNYQGQNIHDQAASELLSNAYGSTATRGSHYRLVGASPVRVYVRPGSTIAIPVAAQSYDASQGLSSIYDQNSQRSSSIINQNAINSEAEVLGTDGLSALKPKNGAKHYESNYSYRKQWEKQDTVTSPPFVVPTVNPYPANSELYEDTQFHGSEHHATNAQENRNIQSSSQYRGYNTKSASSRQQAQERSSLSSSAAASNLANNYDASAYLNSANLNNQVESFGTKPKSYQSSYSYHKSWERQGDPYVIKPSTNGLYSAADSQASERLTSSSNQGSGYGSSRYGAHYHQGQQADCDDNGHIRVARSYNLGSGRSFYQQQSQNLEGLEQQSQNLEDLGQQSQNLEDLGQQSENLDNFGQQTQILDFGQQSQNLEDVGQQSQQLEDFGQQTHNFDALDNLGQQTQNQWDKQTQTNAGHTQNTWSTQRVYGNRNIAQQTNGMERTGYSNQGTLGSVLTTPGIHPNTFAQTLFPERSPEQIKNPQLNFGQRPGYQTPYYRPSSMNQNNLNMYVPMSPLAMQEWQKGLQAQNSLATGYGRQIFNDYQTSTYGSHTYQTPYNYNPFTQPPGYGSTGYTKPMVFPSGYAHNTYTQYPGNINTGLGSNPWLFPSSYNHHSNTNIQSYENGNALTNTQAIRNQSSFTTSNFYSPQESESKSLTNLWNMIDDIEKKTMLQKETENSYNTHQDKTKDLHNNNIAINFTKNNDSYLNSVDKVQRPITGLPSTNDQTIQKTTVEPNKLRPDDTERGDIEPEKLKPQEEVGRGDIGPEDNKPIAISGITPIKTTLYKTPEDIETLSLTKELNTKLTNSHIDEVEKQRNIDQGDKQNETKLGVLPLDDIKKHYSEQDNLGLKSDIQGTTSTTLSGNYHQARNINIEQISQQNIDQQLQGENTDNQLNKSEEQQISKQENSDHLVDFSQQGEKEKHHTERQFNQLNLNHDLSNDKGPALIVKYTDNQNKTIGQERENLSQQSFNQFEDLGQQTGDLDKEHQKLDNFRKQSEDIWQEPQKVDHYGQEREGFVQESLGSFGHHQENLGQETQKINNFGQLDDGFKQESLSNFEQSSDLGQEIQKINNLGQQREGFDQSLGSFGQHKEELGQETQKNSNFGQQSESFQQERLGNLGQQSEDFEQSYDSFGQLSENLGQQTQKAVNFGQESEDFQQESLGSFGQQEENLGQQTQYNHNFGQQTEDFQREKLGNFGQQKENLGQETQKVDNFGQRSENIQQESLGNFEQSENFGQKPQEFDKLGQQSGSFQEGRLVNLGKQSQHLGQESQALDNFGQQSEGFQQESLGKFGKPNINLGQGTHELDNFGQQSEGFQQESLGNFGQRSEYLGQHTQELDTFGQQSEGFQQESLGNYGKSDIHLEQETQELGNFGQQSEGFQQESLGNFGKPTENLDQETQDFNNFGQHNEGFQIEKLGNFGQQSENLGQEIQELDNFGQQSEGFQQESLVNFGKPTEHLDQETQNLNNFGQHNEGFQLEKLGDFGQQSENLGQETRELNNFGQSNRGSPQGNLANFGKQSKNLGLGYQGLDSFGQQNEGFQQGSLGNFGQQSEHFGPETQKLHNFGQQNWGFQQENPVDFGKQSNNLGQGPKELDSLGKQSEGFQQGRSLGNFGQQSEHFGQETQELDNFGQQSEGFNGKSFDVFGQHELQQESLSDFNPQNENLNKPLKEQRLGYLEHEDKNSKQQSHTEKQIPVVEPEFVTKKTNNVDTPPEPVTEKVGFWNKVGSKFGSAKDKVKSWFSGS